MNERAIFAGGCFWCIESTFDETPGVISAVSGYIGGEKATAVYKEVSTGTTGHVEAVEVSFDPTKVSYAELLAIFWGQIDPTDTAGQFADRGSQYATAIFYLNDEQRKIAQESKQRLEASGRYTQPIATKILKASEFFPAEEHHQDYYKKQAEHYKSYRTASGREKYVQDMAQKPMSCPLPLKTGSFEEQKNQLTPEQYQVTQLNATERPFHNEYWDNHREGIYVDIVSGEPLFSSQDKYDSGTGWPSFSKPLDPSGILEKEDTAHGMTRTEVRSCKSNSHLGHVFHDGPQPAGLRYCVNSAALKFIAKEDLEKEGYSEYLKLFKNN